MQMEINQTQVCFFSFSYVMIPRKLGPSVGKIFYFGQKFYVARY